MSCDREAAEEIARYRAALEAVVFHVEQDIYRLDTDAVLRMARAALNPPPPRKPDLDEEIVF